MKKIFILFLLCGCGPQYVVDPNARTVVTVQYEDGPIRVVSPKGEECRSQLDCSNKNEAECAIALYNASEAFIKEGEGLAAKELYLSASVEYMQAMTRLSEAEIRIERIEDFKEWKIVDDFQLKQKLAKRIKLCQQQIFLLKWKRQ